MLHYPRSLRNSQLFLQRASAHCGEERVGVYLARSAPGFLLPDGMQLVPQSNCQFDPERWPIDFRCIDGSYGIKLSVLLKNDPSKIVGGSATVLGSNFEKYNLRVHVRFSYWFSSFGL